MKIVVIVRTRNEERNIERFCKSYQWADKILVADGGSDDNTIEIAKSCPKTAVRLFETRKKMKRGLWRNPEAAHINFLIGWAGEERADWIIFDDADCFPNYKLKQDGRSLFDDSSVGAENSFIYAVKIYFWGSNQHFMRLAQPVQPGKWEPTIWAWRASIGLQAKDTDMAYQFIPYPSVDERKNLLPPYGLLHHSWPNLEETKKKMDFYRLSGQIPAMKSPLHFGGPLSEPPEWARE